MNAQHVALAVPDESAAGGGGSGFDANQLMLAAPMDIPVLGYETPAPKRARPLHSDAAAPSAAHPRAVAAARGAGAAAAGAGAAAGGPRGAAQRSLLPLLLDHDAPAPRHAPPQPLPLPLPLPLPAEEDDGAEAEELGLGAAAHCGQCGAAFSADELDERTVAYSRSCRGCLPVRRFPPAAGRSPRESWVSGMRFFLFLRRTLFAKAGRKERLSILTGATPCHVPVPLTFPLPLPVPLFSSCTHSRPGATEHQAGVRPGQARGRPRHAAAGASIFFFCSVCFFEIAKWDRRKWGTPRARSSLSLAGLLLFVSS